MGQSENEVNNMNLASPPNIDESKGSTRGAAWVSDGQIYVKNPQGNEPKATITGCPEAQVLVNGNPINETTEISQEDVIEIVPLSHTDPGSTRVIISPDKMSAFLEVKLECINTYRLESCQPSSNLRLKAEAIKEIIPPGTVQSLTNLLNQSNVIYGVDTDAIADLVKSLKEGLIPVAKGTPPGDSIDDYIEVFFKENKDSSFEENVSGIIDFKEQRSIPSVSAGETLAKRVVGQKGAPGKTVTNEVAESREPKTIHLLSGSGVDIVEDGLRAVAAIEGLPKLQKTSGNWYLSVEPVLNIPGDVNVKTGNIRFKGDINIQGSVENGMSVSASGNIAVSGILTKCKITAGGNVTVGGNIVNAEIVSGGFNVLCNTINPLLNELLKTLDALYTSATLMLEKLPPNSKVLFGNVLALLIEKRFTSFNGLLEKIQKKFKEVDMKLLGSYEATLLRVVSSLTGINLLQFKTAKDFQDVISDLTSFLYYSDGLTKNRSVVTINVALNSMIKSSGDILVKGPGCFNTVIQADGNVKITGVARGGTIQAQDDVFINEVGSELGAKTTVIVPKEKKIKINKAFDGITLQVGKMSRILEKNMDNIVVKLDTEGYIHVGNE
ncbi:DUF342 domain-containing protein [Desulforamulus ruminis]|uniref:DUF342 domain-containing protein n=1 Tax=Desulforamulus ruminis TaxID=1564 RepID=UPI001EE4B20F|nr:FapA family protein [Desulforamulus ruminis]